jgi:hypothetical protein
MYLPKHQYTVKQTTSTEGRFQYEDGTPFTQFDYVELSNGIKYDVPKSDLSLGDFRRAKKIISPVELLDPKLKLDISKSYIPTAPVGKVTINRYFVKHKVLNKFTEVDQQTYNALNTETASHLEFGQLVWHIAGPKYDINKSGMLQEGTVTKNKRQVEELQKTLPGVSSYLTNLEFLSDPNYKDQEQTSSNILKIILPSPS